MKTTYDHDLEVNLSDRYVDALQELVRARLEMMREQDKGYEECWTWGVAYVGDLASRDALRFRFGGEEDRPEGMQSDAAVKLSDEIIERFE